MFVEVVEPSELQEFWLLQQMPQKPQYQSVIQGQGNRLECSSCCGGMPGPQNKVLKKQPRGTKETRYILLEREQNNQFFT